MSFIIDGITVETFYDGSERMGGDGAGHLTAEMIYTCAWQDHVTVLLALLGYPPPPYTIGSPRPPHRHHRIPALVCSEAYVEPIGKQVAIPNSPGFDIPSPGKAMIHCTYGVPPYSSGAANEFNPAPFDSIPSFGQVRVETSIEVITGGTNQFYFPDGTPAGTLVKQVQRKEYHITFDRLSSYNDELFTQMMGKTNDDVFLGKPAETLLLYGPSTDRVLGPSFSPFTLSFKIVERPVGWNRVWRPGGTPEWQDVIPKPYELTSFIPLITPYNP